MDKTLADAPDGQISPTDPDPRAQVKTAATSTRHSGTRRLKNVRSEMAINVLAYNIKRWSP